MSRAVIPDQPASSDDDLLIGINPSFHAQLQRVADDIRSAGATAESDDDSHSAGPEGDSGTAPDSAGGSYLLSGRWGTGKSSAARYLQQLLAKPAKTHAGPAASTRRMHTPTLLSDPACVRAQLGHALMADVPRSRIVKLVEIVAAATGSRGVSAATTAGEREAEARRILYEQMRGDGRTPFALDALISANLGRDRGPARVLILDEIDRCPPQQTLELLRAIDYWLQAKLVYFVLVCDREHLTAALTEQTRVTGRSPDEALQKYVHHTVEIPDLLDGENLQKYVEGLLDRVHLSDAERALVRDNLGTGGEFPSIQLLDPIFCWVPRNPRTVKQSLNRLLSEVAEIVASDRAELKRRVIRMRWPVFFADHVKPVVDYAAERALSPVAELRRTAGRMDKRHTWLTALAEIGRLAHQDLLPVGGLAFAVDSIGALAAQRRVSLEGMPDNHLVLYLGYGPDLIPSLGLSPLEDSEAGPGHERDGAGDGAKEDSEPHTDLSLSLQQAVIEAQIARNQRSPQALSILRRFAARLSDSRIGRRDAPIIGAAAVEAEHLEEFDLSWQLYKRAIGLRPQDAPLLLNALDLLPKLNTLSNEQRRLGLEWAARARAELGDQPTTSRLRILERFYRKVGEPTEADTFRRRMYETGTANPRLEDFTSMMSLLAEDSQWAQANTYAGAVLAQVNDPAHAYVVLRGWGDAHAARPDRGAEDHGAAAYLDLIASGAACVHGPDDDTSAEENLSDVLGNLAILADRRDLNDLAELLWRWALSRFPDDSATRGPYGRFLNSQGRPEEAINVVRGGPVEEPEGALDLMAARQGFNYATIDRWWTSDLARITAGRQPCLPLQ